METYDETQVMQLLQEPLTRRKAFEIIVRKYREPLYWKIRRIVLSHDDADDVLQNCFMKAWNNLGDFRNESKLSTWLFRIAINESIDFLRRNKNDKNLVADSDDVNITNKLMADEYFDGDEMQLKLTVAISKLPEVQRAVFTMRYYDDMKYSEMSKVLHTTEGALKASYHLAVKKITDFFHNND
jgi:RNA polymerase sigma-70 factor (ECF subfamily)